MCLAIPGQIVSFDPETRGLASVTVGGVRRRVNVDLLREVSLNIGDWVLLHVGFAMSKISEKDAQEQLQILSMLGELDEAMEEVHGYASGD